MCPLLNQLKKGEEIILTFTVFPAKDSRLERSARHFVDTNFSTITPSSGGKIPASQHHSTCIEQAEIYMHLIVHLSFQEQFSYRFFHSSHVFHRSRSEQ